MQDGKSIVNEAVRDAKALKEAAVEAAKNELIEGLVPQVRRLLEKEIKGMSGGSKAEGVNRQRRAIGDNWPGENHTGFEESKSKGEDGMEKDKDMEESMSSFFPQFEDVDMDEGSLDMGEAKLDDLDDEDPECAPKSKKEAAKPKFDEEPMGEDFSLPEAKDKGEDEDEDEDDVAESVEISTESLKRIYDEALQLEVQVKKGFGEMTKSGELDEVDPAGGIADVKSGEHPWEKEEPPAKEDFTVKEQIRRGMQENKILRQKLSESFNINKRLFKKLHEVNLFNSKVLHVNHILSKGRNLTSEQKRVVIESIDKASSINEVKLAYATLVESFRAATKKLTESNARRPKANAQRARTSGTPDQKVLSESVDKSNGSDGYARLRQLAGLVR